MTNPEDHDPSTAYPPSRPTLKLLLAAIAVVVLAVTVMNWSQVSATIHISQIKADIAHAVGL